jgi:hypothetical protein
MFLCAANALFPGVLVGPKSDFSGSLPPSVDMSFSHRDGELFAASARKSE